MLKDAEPPVIAPARLYSRRSAQLCESSTFLASHLLALGEEIGHLGGKHQRAAVVAPDKLHNHLCRLLRLVFLQEVACRWEDRELELACEKSQRTANNKL